MAYSPTLTAFAQSVYLSIKNRYFDDIAGVDGQLYISQVIDWTNQYLDEFETVLDSFGHPVDWNFMRTNSLDFGTAATGMSQIDLDPSILRLIASPKRPVTITVSGKVISSWAVVSPRQFDTTVTLNYATQFGGTLYFNKPISADNDGGIIAGDVTTSLTRISSSDSSVLTTVRPRQLLVLGVVKNSSLPDIVQGGLSPSFVQKYNDLLSSAILFNNATSTADVTDRDDFSFITGVGF